MEELFIGPLTVVVKDLNRRNVEKGRGHGHDNLLRSFIFFPESLIRDNLFLLDCAGDLSHNYHLLEKKRTV